MRVTSVVTFLDFHIITWNDNHDRRHYLDWLSHCELFSYIDAISSTISSGSTTSIELQGTFTTSLAVFYSVLYRVFFKIMKSVDDSAEKPTQIDRDLFYQLASDLSEERLQATVKVVTQLSELPRESGEWNYVLKRLINGLSSSRNGARLGFGLCLTEAVFLALQKEVLPDVGHYMQLLMSALSKDATKNGKEERGLLFGKLFGLQVLLNEPLFSNVFKTKIGAESKSEELNLDFTLKYAQALIDVATTKTWIRESSLYTLYQAIEKLAPLLTSQKALDAAFNLLDESHLTLTSEGLAIYLFLLHTCPATRKLASQNRPNLQNSWKNGDPLKRGNLPLIANALKEANVSEDSSLKQKAVWAPRLHFVWDVLLSAVLSTDSYKLAKSEERVTKKRKKDSHDKTLFIGLPEFWKSVVDDSFFNEKASSERKYLGFLVFEKALQLVPASHLTDLFSTNLMRCSINQCGSSERNLHKISQKSLKSIVSVCQEHPEKTAPVFEAVAFSENGSIHFDQLTKSKTIAGLLANKALSTEHLLTMVGVLTQNLHKKHDDVPMARFTVDAILHLVRAHKSQADILWIGPSFDVLIQLGLFRDQDSPEDNASDLSNQSIGPVAVERLYSMLADLLFAEKESRTICWPYMALGKLLERKKDQPLLNAIDEELSEIFDAAEKELKKVSKQLSKDNSNLQLWGLQLLFSVSLLEAYSGEAESVSVLEDLISFSKIFEGEEENSSYAGFIEILLSLAAQKKALLRKSSLMIWESFVDQVSPEDLSVLLEILPARENKEGYTDLFEGGNKGESSNEEDEDEDENALAEEENDMMSDDGSNDDEESDSNDEDSLNDDAGKIDKEATSALARALNLPDSLVDDKGEVHFDDLGDTGDESEDESEEDLDDEKMMELDGQLSEIFKRRKEALSQIPTGNKRKKEVQESRENVISLKHKVVDMLEVMTKWAESESKKKEFSKALDKVVDTIAPLIACARTTLDRPLAEKVSKLVKNRITKLRVAGTQFGGRHDRDTIAGLLTEIHESMLSKKPGQFPNLYFSMCSSVSIFLAKLMIEMDSSMETYLVLTELYHKSLNEWLIRGKFGVTMFTEFLTWLAVKKQQGLN
ncbi:LAME_0D11056g1_1 [Lachancea meyersii CBS 8951]|uniref:LAME_0D11056g1_1 n=1 Tax=Lachancea meyersii CBS 8951 TaxID=1266667 RepID=A0A1G4JCE3_9SACH|nr:LAME_0D11056g1_1 [Lachancea meyersii CBS 8951]